MHHPTRPDAQIEARLEKLERQQRRMRWACLLLLLALLGSCGRKAALPAEIVAREFKVMDDQGHLYASLGIAPWNPEGVMMLRDPADGNRRTSIAPAEMLLDGGESIVQVEADDVAFVAMRDRHDWTGAKLSAHPASHKSALWLENGKDSIYCNP